jgi:hypothetical protein
MSAQKRISTFRSAATFVFFGTFGTLNKQYVAAMVGTIGVCVARFATLMATGNNLPVYTFTKSFIENKVFANEF